MRILITGGSGFVGRNFVKHFLANSFSVVNVDSYIAGGGSKQSNDWLPSHQGEYQEFRIDCRRYFDQFPHEKFDLVLHLAAVVGGRLTIEKNPLAVADEVETVLKKRLPLRELHDLHAEVRFSI